MRMKVKTFLKRVKKVEGIKAIPNIKTVNFAIKRDALIACGGFDDDLSHMDEGELLARLCAKTKTGKILYDPEIIVYHKHSQPTNIIKRMGKVFRKSIIGTAVFLKPYVAKVALANPLSPFATGFYLVIAWFFGVPLFLLSVVLGVSTIFLLISIFIYILLLCIHVICMFIRRGKLVASVPFMLTIDTFVRLIGTFVGLVLFARSLVKRLDSYGSTSEKLACPNVNSSNGLEE
jgi:hypothetical protein